MATISIRSKPQPRIRYDHIFFPAFAVLIAIVVFIGFAQTYYLHGFLHIPAFKAILAPPFPWIVHVHAVVFTSWIILLVVQTSLVTAHRVDLHRWLGLFGFGLACVMPPVVFAAMCTQLVRLHPPSQPLVLPWFQFVDLAVFSTLIYFGYRQRRNPAAHKRLVIIGTIALLGAAFARWPTHFVGHQHNAYFACYGLVLLLAGYDLFSTRKIHRATLWGGAFLVISRYPIESLLYKFVPGHQAALFMQALGRHLL